MQRYLVMNGPNLNLLGEREPGVYGSGTLADLETMMRAAAAKLGVEVDFMQSNHEGVLIDAIHDARHDCVGIVINGQMVICDNLDTVCAGKTLEDRFFEIYEEKVGNIDEK